jgi:hypothetical protein
MMENVWGANMAIMVISVKKVVLGTVKEDVLDLSAYVVHAQKGFTVAFVICHVLKIAWETPVQETVSVFSVDPDTEEVNAMNTVLNIVRNVSNMISIVRTVRTDGGA